MKTLYATHTEYLLLIIFEIFQECPKHSENTMEVGK